LAGGEWEKKKKKVAHETQKKAQERRQTLTKIRLIRKGKNQYKKGVGKARFKTGGGTSWGGGGGGFVWRNFVKPCSKRLNNHFKRGKKKERTTTNGGGGELSTETKKEGEGGGETRIDKKTMGWLSWPKKEKRHRMVGGAGSGTPTITKLHPNLQPQERWPEPTSGWQGGSVWFLSIKTGMSGFSRRKKKKAKKNEKDKRAEITGRPNKPIPKKKKPQMPKHPTPHQMTPQSEIH